MDFLIQYISRILHWILSFVGWCATELFKLVLAGIAAVFNAIPVPDWMQNAGNAISNFPPGAAYFLNSMHIVTGMGILLGSFGLRFLIRRIPIFG